MTFIDPEMFGVSDLTAELYGALAPGQTGGEPRPENPDDLLAFAAALSKPLDVLWEIVQNNWETALSPEATPAEALGWLGQFVGVRLESSWTEQESRDAVEQPEGFARGTTPALVAAIRRTLTGSKTILVVERFDGNPGELFIRTRSSETPNEAATRAVAAAKKAAGLLLNFDAIAGIDFDTLLATTTDFDDVHTTYASFADVVADLPI